MDNLPKRSDDIYKEIESFEDYELTQCVAYEMAVRNDEIDRLFGLAGLKFRLKNKNDVDIVSDYLDVIIQDKEKSERKQAIDKLSSYGFNIFECSIYKMKKEIHKSRNPNNLILAGAGVIYSPENTKIKDILNKDELNELCKIEIEEYNSEDWVSEDRRIKTNEEFLSMCSDLEYPLSEKSDEIIKNALKRNNQIAIEKDFSRPFINASYTPIVNIDINLALSEHELIEYIKLLKRKKPNTPLEFLGETLEDATPKKDYPKKPTAQKMADMFFIYDYVKVRLKNIQEENKNNTIELEEEIENIKKFHIGADRKKRIAYAKAEHLESTIDTKIIDIFKEDELTKILNLSGANISKLYYAMKPYIDDLKYKELITGVSTN